VDPKEFLAEFLYPARSLATLLAMLVFYALLLLAIKAGFLGIWLAICADHAHLHFTPLQRRRAPPSSNSPLQYRGMHVTK
jgi:hypothetical protein